MFSDIVLVSRLSQELFSRRISALRYADVLEIYQLTVSALVISKNCIFAQILKISLLSRH